MWASSWLQVNTCKKRMRRDAAAGERSHYGVDLNISKPVLWTNSDSQDTSFTCSHISKCHSEKPKIWKQRRGSISRSWTERAKTRTNQRPDINYDSAHSRSLLYIPLLWENMTSWWEILRTEFRVQSLAQPTIKANPKPGGFAVEWSRTSPGRTESTSHIPVAFTVCMRVAQSERQRMCVRERERFQDREYLGKFGRKWSQAASPTDCNSTTTSSLDLCLSVCHDDDEGDE